MQDHLDRTRTETAAIRTQVDKARKVLEGLGSLDLSSFKMQGEEEGGSSVEGDAAKVAVATTSQTEEEKREAAALEREAAAWATADALIL